MTITTAGEACRLLGITAPDLSKLGKARPEIKIERGKYNLKAIQALSDIPSILKEYNTNYKKDWYDKNKEAHNKQCVGYQRQRYNEDEEYRQKRIELSKTQMQKRRQKNG